MPPNASDLPEQVLTLPVEAGARLPAGDRVADALRGFGPLGILAIVVILAGNLVVVPLSAVLVLLWARRSGTPWRDIGYVRPKSWTRTVAVGIVFGVAFKLLMKTIVMPLLGADPINQAYHYLVGNPAALPWMLYAAIIGAGFGEETLFRGYLFERLGKLLREAPEGSAAQPRRRPFDTLRVAPSVVEGRAQAGGGGAPPAHDVVLGVWARTSIVLLTAGLFGVAHYAHQGLAGAQQATIFGLVFGTIFAVTGRIWMLMFAHAAFDVTALAIIYWNLESHVAHLVFK